MEPSSPSAPARRRVASGGGGAGASADLETRVGAEGSSKRNIVRKHGGGGGGGAAALDKKMGGGQKGKWSALDDGSLYAEADVRALDAGDPAYDSEEEAPGESERAAAELSVEAEVRRRMEQEVERGVGMGETATLSLPEFKARIKAILAEYFESEDAEEVVRSVRELDTSVFHYELVKRSVSMSMDRHERERELVSRLLSQAYPDLLNRRHLEKGFERLFEAVDELSIDVPAAVDQISIFLARAVVDDLLPPSFLSDSYVRSVAPEILQKARNLLSRDHIGAKLERIWGPGDGRPVQEMKVALDQLLEEYINSRDATEACRCITELHAPHFHHELVKRAVVRSFDKTAQDRATTSQLFGTLHENGIVNRSQFVKGFDRLYALMPELIIDCPRAPDMLAHIVASAVEDGVLPPSYRNTAANRVLYNQKTTAEEATPPPAPTVGTE